MTDTILDTTKYNQTFEEVKILVAEMLEHNDIDVNSIIGNVIVVNGVKKYLNVITQKYKQYGILIGCHLSNKKYASHNISYSFPIVGYQSDINNTNFILQCKIDPTISIIWWVFSLVGILVSFGILLSITILALLKMYMNNNAYTIRKAGIDASKNKIYIQTKKQHIRSTNDKIIDFINKISRNLVIQAFNAKLTIFTAIESNFLPAIKMKIQSIFNAFQKKFKDQHYHSVLIFPICQYSYAILIFHIFYMFFAESAILSMNMRHNHYLLFAPINQVSCLVATMFLLPKRAILILDNKIVSKITIKTYAAINCIMLSIITIINHNFYIVLAISILLNISLFMNMYTVISKLNHKISASFVIIAFLCSYVLSHCSIITISSLRSTGFFIVFLSIILIYCLQWHICNKNFISLDKYKYKSLQYVIPRVLQKRINAQLFYGIMMLIIVYIILKSIMYDIAIQGSTNTKILHWIKFENIYIPMVLIVYAMQYLHDSYIKNGLYAFLILGAIFILITSNSIYGSFVFFVNLMAIIKAFILINIINYLKNNEYKKSFYNTIHYILDILFLLMPAIFITCTITAYSLIIFNNYIYIALMSLSSIIFITFYYYIANSISRGQEK